MHVVDPELEAFKTEINLTEYAAASGYEIDRRESSRNSIVMRHPGGDKIIIAHEHDGHWIYFSVRSDADNGSIIDFVQNRKGGSLGPVRQALRPWIGQGRAPTRPPAAAYAAQVEPSSKDIARVIAEFGRMEAVARHPYLEGRGIPPAILEQPRFARSVLMDRWGNAVFPHYDDAGLCGYEIKNRGFTGFARGGEKGLWSSAAQADDMRLVIAESAIDALSHAVLFPDERARYASTGGKMNPAQPELIRSAILALSEGAAVVIATDADAAGRQLAAEIAAIAEATGRAGLTVIRSEPSAEGTDWNDHLKPRQADLFPVVQSP